jgi:hypothetical protein
VTSRSDYSEAITGEVRVMKRDVGSFSAVVADVFSAEVRRSDQISFRARGELRSASLHAVALLVVDTNDLSSDVNKVHLSIQIKKQKKEKEK